MLDRLAVPMTAVVAAVVVALAVIAAAIALTASQSYLRIPFKATSLDGVSLFGEIDAPRDATARAVVLMAPGTGGFTRDVKFGVSGGPGDLVFKTLAARFTAEGLAVVRFDERGVGCADPAQALANLACRDDRILGAVTPQSKVDDLAAVSRAAMKDPHISGKPLILFAHSEGMLTAAKAIEQGLVKPVAIIGVGALMESPQSVLRWQIVDREAESLKMMDTDHDGSVSADELRRNWARTPIGVFPFSEAMVPKSGVITAQDIADDAKRWQAIYDSERKEALSHADTDVYTLAGRTVASYAWWKQWFLDDTPVSRRLAAFHGPVRLFYGAIDSQAPASRQLAAIGTAAPGLNVTSTVLPDVGHTLGAHPLFGPMTPEALDDVVGAAAGLAARRP